MSGPLALRFAALAVAVAVTACSHGDAPKPKIALISDVAGFDDGSRNQAARTGLEQCGALTGADVDAVTSKSRDDYATNLNLLGTEGYALIETAGPDLRDDIANAARHFPEVRFALIGAEAGQPNVASIRFREQETGFVAGALAALASKSKRVALTGGIAGAVPPALAAGFVAGARQIDPAVRANVAYAGTFTAAGAVESLAKRQLQAGADVLFVVAGPAGAGAFDAVSHARDARAVGVDVDQSALAPGRVVGSVLDRVDVAASRACQDTVSDKAASGTVELGIADGAIGLADPYRTEQAIGAQSAATLSRIERAIAAGTLVPPATAAAAAAFKPVALR